MCWKRTGTHGRGMREQTTDYGLRLRGVKLGGGQDRCREVHKGGGVPGNAPGESRHGEPPRPPLFLSRIRNIVTSIL